MARVNTNFRRDVDFAKNPRGVLVIGATGRLGLLVIVGCLREG